jgi:disulfide bond formation protein DsbB
VNAATSAVYRAFMVALLLVSVGALLALLWRPEDWWRLLIVAAVAFLAAAVSGYNADERERRIG